MKYTPSLAIALLFSTQVFCMEKKPKEDIESFESLPLENTGNTPAQNKNTNGSIAASSTDEQMPRSRPSGQRNAVKPVSHLLI